MDRRPRSAPHLFSRRFAPSFAHSLPFPRLLFLCFSLSLSRALFLSVCLALPLAFCVAGGRAGSTLVATAGLRRAMLPPALPRAPATPAAKRACFRTVGRQWAAFVGEVSLGGAGGAPSHPNPLTPTPTPTPFPPRRRRLSGGHLLSVPPLRDPFSSALPPFPRGVPEKKRVRARPLCSARAARLPIRSLIRAFA